MCQIAIVPFLADDLLRLLISFLLLLCCIVLSFIFAKKKAWDIAFWISFSLFLFSLGGYGYIVHHIYLANTFSYDGFISGAAFITVCGLLFSRRRYSDFTDKLFSSTRAPILFATFLVFAFIYLQTVKFDFDCIVSRYTLFNDILQIVMYPLLLLFAISAFLYRFSICISVFVVSMALFIVENVVFITHAWVAKIEYQIFVEEIICALISIVLSCVAVFMLTRAKIIYKENKKCLNK